MTQFPDIRFIKSAHKPRDFPPDSGREVAFAGRSNAGKSSAINTIVARRGLARTSKTPGRTQLINFFGLADDQRLVDLPGYGFARVPAEVRNHWRELMQDYFAGRGSLAGVMLIVDIRRGLGEFDGQMLDWAMASGCPVHILLTKADKLKRGGVAKAVHETEKALARDYASTAQATLSLQVFSSLKNTGVDDAREVLREWLVFGESGA
ncbi:MAG: YihA family ribosome biogenesis GTP-binding protein [Gammaproteobacteria bacterium]|nr:YihA family ribosome biogenesis GTP-binding protein [Gammaproteobacteria bacterium]